MPLAPLPFRSTLADYERQAEQALAGWQACDAQAIEIFRHHHPRFLDDNIKWLPRNMSEAEVRGASIDLADARLAVARVYSFQDWSRLAEWAQAIAQVDSPVGQFEAAVEAVIAGDETQLERLLRANPALVHARSNIVTCHDPPVHGATLLHYLGANGVENFRQKSPPNAAAVAKMLLDAGAEPDALASMYGGRYTTMNMLASSTPPAEAGVQVALIETLLHYGAALEGRGEGQWTSPLMTALVFGFRDSAEALERRGAAIDTLAAAAGLGRLADVKRLLALASQEDRHLALALAAQLGHVECLRALLDAGEDPNRYNPACCHAHATPLHQAALGGHFAAVRLLIEHGARLDFRDSIYDSTPLGWAEHGG